MIRLKNIIYMYMLRKKIKKNKKRIILLNTPVHSNLGDHAIASGEKKFIKHFFDAYGCIEIEETKCTPRKLNYLSKHISCKDIIMLQGGGFMGGLWPRHEKRMLEIINYFPDNIKIIMPQTCYFEEESDEIIEKYKNLFADFRNIVFIAREKNTLYLFRKICPKESEQWLYPDMALINEVSIKMQRNGIGICLREDKEKIIPEKVNIILESFIYENAISALKFSTVEDYSIPIRKRDKYLYDIWEFISSKRLIITDRLHCMLFAVITGTPCVVFDNLSGKISGVYYQWIYPLDYVKMLNPDDLSKDILMEYYKKDDTDFRRDDLYAQFRQLAKKIHKLVEEKF